MGDYASDNARSVRMQQDEWIKDGKCKSCGAAKQPLLLDHLCKRCWPIYHPEQPNFELADKLNNELIEKELSDG